MVGPATGTSTTGQRGRRPAAEGREDVAGEPGHGLRGGAVRGERHVHRCVGGRPVGRAEGVHGEQFRVPALRLGGRPAERGDRLVTAVHPDDHLGTGHDHHPDLFSNPQWTRARRGRRSGSPSARRTSRAAPDAPEPVAAQPNSHRCPLSSRRARRSDRARSQWPTAGSVVDRGRDHWPGPGAGRGVTCGGASADRRRASSAIAPPGPAASTTSATDLSGVGQKVPVRW
jgi:hypothetical protein